MMRCDQRNALDSQDAGALADASMGIWETGCFQKLRDSADTPLRYREVSSPKLLLGIGASKTILNPGHFGGAVSPSTVEGDADEHHPHEEEELRDPRPDNLTATSAKFRRCGQWQTRWASAAKQLNVLRELNWLGVLFAGFL